MKRTLFYSLCAVTAISVATVASRTAQGGQADALVRLQASTPGVTQNGNSNISGTSRASEFKGGLVSINSLSSIAAINSVIASPVNYVSAVFGQATNTTVQNYGGYFYSAGPNGSGCVGWASSAVGNPNGGWFRSDAPGGNGVTAIATATTGDAYGGNFYSNSSVGVGVYGEATSTTGTTYGGKFVNNSPYGSAVYGIATSTGGGATGGYFESPYWAGVYGKSIDGPGVIGQSDTYYGGYFLGAIGVQGDGNTGVAGYSNATSGTGVYGQAGSSTAAGYGVKGVSQSSTGWAGHFSGGKGLYATTLQVNTRTTTDDFTMTTGGADNTVLLGATGGVASWGTVGNTRLTSDSASLSKVTGGKFAMSGSDMQGFDQSMIQLFTGAVEKIRLNPQNATSSGAVILYGPNGEFNVRLAALGTNNPNNGFVGVYDSAGASQATMSVDAGGLGVLTADTKNFKVPDPTNPRYDILYACVEGPEAAMYTRGTGRLVNGQAVIDLPDHFLKLANMSTLTIQVTPLDECEGLFCRKGDGQFMVKELRKGTSSIEFDWEVKAVRMGHEDYKVVRPWDDALPDGDKKQMWEARLRSIEAKKNRKQP